MFLRFNYTRLPAWNSGASALSVMNDSLDSPDELKRTHQEPKRTRQEPAEGIAGERTLVKTMAREENTGTTKATGVRTKWQGDGTGGSPVYIKFSHIA